MYQTKEDYDQLVRGWEAGKPHNIIVQPKGNSMTQKYYTERLLPVYINAVKTSGNRYPGPWLLQEDNDPSHGLRGKKKGLAQLLRDTHSIKSLQHPSNSPDFNPIEACWNILKQRVRRRIWNTLDELKEILLEEWKLITMEEVRSRISGMPSRCERVVENGGEPIKSAQW